MRLTAEQRAAVNERGNVCLVSCPGSGKTRTIVAKLIHCIDTVEGSTRRVACITHTNAAADEIDCRLREICFGNEDIYYDVCTIHGFALQNILRPFSHLLPEFGAGFTVLTSSDEVYIAKAEELIALAGTNVQFEEFERIQRNANGHPMPLDTVPEEIQREWCRWLDANALVTLNEIVYHAGRLVSSYGHIASALASRFAWILVDEFQDSSAAQILILKEIHRYGRTTFFCVGDPNQSIYGFAGASPGLLEDFARHIGANTAHRLTGNFRSSARICAKAELLCNSVPPMQAVGRHADFQLEPQHLTVAAPINGISDNFLPSIRQLGIPLGNAAVLAPSWFSLFTLAGQLRRAGVPCIGPGARPYKRSHFIGHLLEPLGAFLEGRSAAMAIAVQRALYTVIAELTGHPSRSIFDFKGRVAVCKILAEATTARRTSGLAVVWITDVSTRIAETLAASDFIAHDHAAQLRESAGQMVQDIQNRPNGAGLTVAELGIFAHPENCLQLLTVHKAKGREFDAVAVIEMHDGRFPFFTINQLTDEQERAARYAESRRVVYVAATRAERILMFFSDRRDFRNRPSPFLQEMQL